MNWSLRKKIIIFLIALVLALMGFFLLKVGKTFSLVNVGFWKRTFKFDNYREKDRVDILVLGMRGENDIEEMGKYLTDTIMILSVKTDENKAAMASIPRDLYVKIPQHSKMEKINYAYAYGNTLNGDGLGMAEIVVEEATGVDIDYVAVIDFSAFKKLIDMVGGIDVYAPREFVETSQWGWEFRVPQGMNHMNGETALYYARSRYSTSDFDRSRRQQDIIMALGDKLMRKEILANPIKLNAVLNAVSDGIDTNIDLISLLGMVKYADILKNNNIRKLVLDDSENSLLTSGHINGSYVLYPKEGMENYSRIREKFRNIFEDAVYNNNPS